MSFVCGEHLRTIFAPPRYLAFPLSGIDISTSSIKAVRLVEGANGLVMESFADVKIPSGAFADGEIVDQNAIITALASVVNMTGISAANAALPESKSFLFETTAAGTTLDQWRIAIEQQLDELVPLPPPETDFDIVDTGQGEHGETLITGIGFARRIVDNTLATFNRVPISIRALEGEIFAMARALLLPGDTATTLIIDIGKTTTKIGVIAGRIPHFATTIGIGGHALSLAVQKHFGVTEAEARKIKYERGIVPTPGNEDYLATMLSTISAIRDEISSRLNYWQQKAVVKSAHEPVSRALLVGGNASVRGLPEYLEGALQIPVATGDVFTNLASRDTWIPSLDYTESLAYATAVGCALYDYAKPYA